VYLDAFDPDQAEVAKLRAHYERGGLGDALVKRRLDDVLQNLLGPMRERREQFARDLGEVEHIIAQGTREAREVAAVTLDHVRAVFGLRRVA
jgi:tryptophanyl-tRNA synthetase